MNSDRHIVKEKNDRTDQDVGTDIRHQAEEICVEIYVTENCFVCDFAYEVVDMIRREFPQVNVRMVNVSTTDEEIPDAVFATPTYLLNGCVWSLGNPSLPHVTEKLQGLLQETAT